MSPVSIEGLEDRRLLSGAPAAFAGIHNHGAESTIEFSLAPDAVKTGLTALAGTDNVAAPTGTDVVHLGNSNGVETYTLDVTGTGTETKLTVDQNGNAVTPLTFSTTTFGEVTNTAVTDEFKAIATGLGLAAPASTDEVSVATASDGSATYSIHLTAAATTTTTSTTTTTAVADASDVHEHGVLISVDSSGNPVGNERVPLSVLSAAIQAGLTSNAPTGATALTGTSLVDVQTVDGVTLYSVKYTATGVSTTVTVNISGALTSKPAASTAAFSTIPQAAQTELQTLATADGSTATIAGDQNVIVYTEPNGTTIYAVSVTATSTTSGTTSTTSTGSSVITIAVDQAGNPTVLPHGNDLDGFHGRGGRGGDFGGGGDCGPGTSGSSGTTATSTTTATGTTSGTTTNTGTALLATSASATQAAALTTSSTTSSSKTAKSSKKTKHAVHHTKHHG